MDIETELYSQAMDQANGDREHAEYLARMELERLADAGYEEAINCLSHKIF